MAKQENRPADVDGDTQKLLRHFIKEKFPGQTVVTASLMASSIVVLKMISEIDCATPVIFCRRPPAFKESTEYRTRIVESLGLKNVSINEGHEAQVKPGDKDHCEHMWVHCDVPGRSFQLLHLNDSLAPFSCWISAVYHDARQGNARRLVEVEGRLTRVDPLFSWSKDDVRSFMSAHNLPYHEMAKRKYDHNKNKEKSDSLSYHY